MSLSFLHFNIFDIVIVQIYISTTDHEDDEKEKMYDEISDILHQEGRGQVNTIVMGNFNSIVEEDLRIKW